VLLEAHGVRTISSLQVACVDDVDVQLLMPGQDAGCALQNSTKAPAPEDRLRRPIIGADCQLWGVSCGRLAHAITSRSRLGGLIRLGGLG
jgi:hypothetical protein